MSADPLGIESAAAMAPSLTPHSYVQETLRQIWDELPALTLEALLFSVCAAPALSLLLLGDALLAALVALFTLPPAWMVLLALQGKRASGRSPDFMATVAALPHLAAQGLFFAVMALIPISALLLTWPLLAAPAVPLVIWIGLAADGLGLLLWMVLLLYAAPLMALYAVNMRTAIRNSLLLASRHIVNTVGILALAVLFGLAILYVHNGLMLLLPAVWSFFVINNCRLVVALEEDRYRQESSRR